jgi:Domain of unknown function (DUF4253)
VTIPDNGVIQLGGLALPPGRQRRAVSRFGDDGQETSGPAYWVTDDLVSESGLTWFELGQRSSSTGLVPVLLESDTRNAARPWESGELRPVDLSGITALDAATVLRRRWSLSVPSNMEIIEFSEMFSPYSAMFPGLGLAEQIAVSAAELREVLATQPAARLALFPLARSADIVAYVGWPGAGSLYDTAAPVSAVLRSWEERYGARVFRVGPDTIDLIVQRPPRHPADALAVAAEQFALCPDIVVQAEGSIQALADQILGEPLWSLWWDDVGTAFL